MNKEPDKKIIEELVSIFNQKKFKILIRKLDELQIRFPNSIFILNLLGAINNEEGNLGDAISYFKKIILLNKNFADAYYNLGVIYKKINNVEESIHYYTECIKINPRKYEAYNNLGNIYRDKNDLEKAVEKYLQCLEINSNYLVALQNFGICLQNFHFNIHNKIVDKHIVNLLKQNKILRPVDIINSLINYLYLNPKFKIIIENTENLYKKNELIKHINQILEFNIFICLLKITPIPDLKIEKFLINLRKEILLNINLIKNNDSTLKIINAIAQQCFINEYIYPVSKSEKNKIEEIEKKILKNLSKENSENIYLEITCLASYKQLTNYTWTDKINNQLKILDLINQQITEPAVEKLLQNEFSPNNIKNPISLKVKDQYENSPYPRWTKIALNNKPDNIVNFFTKLKLNFEIEKLKNCNEIQVLVAGCGTGQHAITTATKYENSFITAIDLSSKSLSYAKRKSDELGIKNIEFIQTDILNFKNFNKKFDIIESVGVLHHMDDPFEGFQILTNILKDQGMIMIGLYSKTARQHITKIRSKFKNLNNEDFRFDILRSRENIIDSDNKDYELIKQSPDFYSLSTLKDLLFHIQEHTFDIEDIKNFIDRLNLTFCGFENRQILNRFQKKYKEKNCLYDLKLWNKFENENPRIFAGMYQFWCQK